MHRRGLTLIEIAVVLIIFVIAFAVLVPSSNRNRQRGLMARNNTQVRGIHQGFVIYSQGNNGYYAGLTKEGQLISGMPATVPTRDGGAWRVYHADDGHMASLAMATMLNGSYFTPMFYLSPGEINPGIRLVSFLPTDTQLLTPMNFSYSLSRAADPTADAGRIGEWRDNSNAKSIVVTDRVLKSRAEAAPGEVVAPHLRRSIWTSSDGSWRGSVAHGDNSVQFLTTAIQPTSYSKDSAPGAPVGVNPADDLFTPAGAADAFQFRD